MSPSDGTTHYEGCWQDMPKHSECKGFKDGYAAGYEKAKEQAAKIAIEVGDRNLEASSRAELAGRELVKHCRMSDYETSEEIVAKIREMKSS